MTGRFIYHPEKFDGMRDADLIDHEDFDMYMQDGWAFKRDDDGFAAALLFQSAKRAGVIESPGGVTAYFMFIPGAMEDAPSYQYNLYLDLTEGRSLKVSTFQYEYPDFCIVGATGRAAVEGMLKDAVAAMNAVLDNVDEFAKGLLRDAATAVSTVLDNVDAFTAPRRA
jgi:hypothetical protein